MANKKYVQTWYVNKNVEQPVSSAELRKEELLKVLDSDYPKHDTADIFVSLSIAKAENELAYNLTHAHVQR